MAAGGEACGLARGVDTPDMHRHRRESAQTQDEDGDQRCHRERRFDRGAATFTGQTFVLRARLMMLVNALTIESPVTTV